MRIEQFTQKAQEAIVQAQNLAQTYDHPTIDPEHLLSALVGQEGGVAPAVLERIGVDGRGLMQALAQALGKKPRAAGAGTAARRHWRRRSRHRRSCGQ